jgi:nitrogen fixation/metabolism regulation signal transduction histidine kinase
MNNCVTYAANCVSFQYFISPLITGKVKGTGMGLEVVKRIVAAHGATVTFEREQRAFVIAARIFSDRLDSA